MGDLCFTLPVIPDAAKRSSGIHRKAPSRPMMDPGAALLRSLSGMTECFVLGARDLNP